MEKKKQLIFLENPKGIVKTKDKNGDLFLLSNDEIKKDDWYYNSIDNSIKQASDWIYVSTCKKIIATTNNLRLIVKDEFGGVDNQHLPKIPTSFIQYYMKQYNISNVITEVEVEYEIWNIFSGDHNNTPREISLKINSSDNTINIRPLKNSWARKEVINLLDNFNTTGKFSDPYKNKIEFDKWIENNL